MSLLGFEEGRPHSKGSYIATKISKIWLGEKKCKNEIIANFQEMV